MASLGQLAATTPASIVAASGGTKPRCVSLFFYNAHATDDQEIEVTLTRGGTELTLATSTIKKKEQLVIANLGLEPSDVVKAAATAGTSVNYFIMPGLPDAPVDVFSVDAAGSRKATAVTAGQSFSQDISFADSVKLKLGTGDDITIAWDGTDLDVLQAAPNSAINFGVDGAGIDMKWFGDTASTFMLWDQSADSLILTGAAPLVFTGTTGQPRVSLTDNLADALSVGIAGSTDLLVLTTTDNAESVAITGTRYAQSTAVAITGATALKLSDSGGVFTVAQSSAYDVDLPSPTSGAGCTYFFSLTAPGAFNVTVTVAGGAATFVGHITIDGATVVATGATLTFASGSASLGDSIFARSLATNLYHITAIASGAGGITIA